MGMNVFSTLISVIIAFKKITELHVIIITSFRDQLALLMGSLETAQQKGVRRADLQSLVTSAFFHYLRRDTKTLIQSTRVITNE